MTEILVLGAGMVGISSALALQEKGHTVIVIERGEPGRETSYGNAGVIQREAAEPYAIPRDFGTLFRYATGQTNDIIYRLTDLPRVAPALLSYFRYSALQRHAIIAQTYAKLIAESTNDHASLIEASGSDNLIRRTGFYQVYRTSRTFDAAASDAERLKKTYGTASKLLDNKALHAEEPALISDVAGAVLWTDSWTTTSPGNLTAAYARLFESRGGKIISADAGGLEKRGASWSLETPEGEVTGEQVVVALGPWAPDLLKRFGYNIPMVWKRGYHGHFETEVPLNRPLMDAANGVVLSAMQQGLRITTGAELTRRDAPANLTQLERGAAGARELLKIGPLMEGSTWFGHRPCMPDMLPLVGPAPKHKGLWFNFGHGHQGLTLGPTTGRILAEMLDGQLCDELKALKPESRSWLR